MAMDEKSAAATGSPPAAALSMTMPATPDRLHIPLSKESMDMSMSQCPTPREEYDPSSTHPFSPFYSHPTTRTSFEQLKNSSTAVLNVYEHDLEAGSRSRISCDPSADGRTTHTNCKVWPERKELAKQKKALKKTRGCYPWRQMNKTQKLWAKIVIALLIVGICLAIGLGVSKAVGGGVYKNSTTTTPIGGS